MEFLSIAAATLSVALLSNVVIDMIGRFLQARKTTSIELKVGNAFVKFDAANSGDAEAIIEAYLSRAHASAGADADEGKPEVKE